MEFNEVSTLIYQKIKKCLPKKWKKVQINYSFSSGAISVIVKVGPVSKTVFNDNHLLNELSLVFNNMRKKMDNSVSSICFVLDNKGKFDFKVKY